MKMLPTILANGANTPIFVLLIILAIFAAIALVAFIIYRVVHPKLKNEEKSKADEDKALNEELNRVLEPVKDDELRKQIEDYKESDDVDK